MKVLCIEIPKPNMQWDDLPLPEVGEIYEVIGNIQYSQSKTKCYILKELNVTIRGVKIGYPQTCFVVIDEGDFLEFIESPFEKELQSH
jgi:hypothetical protein